MSLAAQHHHYVNVEVDERKRLGDKVAGSSALDALNIGLEPCNP